VTRAVRTVPRKRPRQERSQQTVDAILQAAARVLVRDGFDRTSTNRVADEAGVSIGSLYQYFPSKEALVATLVERHTDEMLARLRASLPELVALPLPRAARRVVELILAAHAVEPELHRVFVEQVPRVGRLDRLHDVERQAMTIVRALLEVHRREVRAANLDRMAWMTIIGVEAITHATLFIHPDWMTDPTLAHELTHLVVSYLSRGPRRPARRSRQSPR
jgi:AcrR family transcriptional regulator